MSSQTAILNKRFAISKLRSSIDSWEAAIENIKASAADCAITDAGLDLARRTIASNLARIAEIKGEPEHMWL